MACLLCFSGDDPSSFEWLLVYTKGSMAAADSLACVEGMSYVAFSVTAIELNLFILPLAAFFFMGKSLDISSHIILT